MEEVLKMLDAISLGGRQAPPELHVDLAALVREALMALPAGAGGGRIIWDIDALPPVRGDRALLRVVLLNLLSHAVASARAGFQTTLGIGLSQRSESDVVVFICDRTPVQGASPSRRPIGMVPLQRALSAPCRSCSCEPA